MTVNLDTQSYPPNRVNPPAEEPNTAQRIQELSREAIIQHFQLNFDEDRVKAIEAQLPADTLERMSQISNLFAGVHAMSSMYMEEVKRLYPDQVAVAMEIAEPLFRMQEVHQLLALPHSPNLNFVALCLAEELDFERIGRALAHNVRLLNGIDSLVLQVDFSENSKNLKSLIRYLERLNPKLPEDWIKAHALYSLFLNISAHSPAPALNETIQKFWNEAFLASIQKREVELFQTLHTQPIYLMPAGIDANQLVSLDNVTADQASHLLRYPRLLSNCNHISFDSTVTENTLIAVLREMPCLKSLGFSGNRMLSDRLINQLPPRIFTQLEKLDVTNGIIEPIGFNRLLSVPTLKKLALNNCGTLELNAESPTANLEELCLIETHIQCIEKLLTKNLKKLHLESLDDFISPKSADYSGLRELMIIDTTIESEEHTHSSPMIQLLKTPAQLKKLVISPSLSEIPELPPDTLQHLEELTLTSYSVQPHVIALLGRMKELRKLTLGPEGYDNPFPTEIPDLSLLEELHLVHASLNRSMLGQLLTSTSHLKKLELERCFLGQAREGDIPEGILPELEELIIMSNYTNESERWDELLSLGQLKKLHLYPHRYSSSLLSRFMVQKISAIHSLEELEMDFSLTGEQVAAILSNLPNLQKLSLEIQGEILHPLQLSQLRSLRLAGYLGIGMTIPNLISRSTKLEILDLSLTNFLNTTHFLSPISSHVIANLTEVALPSKCSDTDLNYLVTHALALKELDFSKCTTITDRAFQNLPPRSFEQLRVLRVSPNISERPLQRILDRALHLRELNLKYTRLSHLPRLREGALKHLEVVYLDQSHFNDSGLRALLQLTPHLNELSIQRCAHMKRTLISGITHMLRSDAQPTLALPFLNAFHYFGSNIDPEQVKEIKSSSLKKFRQYVYEA